MIDELGRVLAAREFLNDERGHDSFLAWIDEHDRERSIGIEGSGSYGAGLARRLIERNERVFEVLAFLSHRERRKRPARGKSDPDDASAIARVVARGEGLSSPARNDVLEDLKLLSDHRDQLVRTRTQLINRTHRDPVVTRPGYELRIPKLTSKKKLAEARRLLRGDGSIRAELIRERIGEITRLNDKIAAAEKRIALKVRESNTTLTQLRGVGFVVAAKILGEVGDPSRIRSKGSFGDAHGHGADSGLIRPDATSSAQSRREPSIELRAIRDGARPLSG